MAINWGEAEEKAGGQFKDYAPSGTYKVKVISVDHHEAGQNGSIAQDFKFAETDDYQFPKVTHWLSFKNDNWRFIHNRSLMVLFGATKEQAQKAIETCESKSKKEDIIKAYQQTYERLLAKKPAVEIEVWPDGKYSRADFTASSVRMSHPDDEPYQKSNGGDEILDGAEEVKLDADLDIPF